jgi:hypothetical protein
MKKYLMFIKHAEQENPGPIPPALGQAMEKFVTEGFQSGQLKDTAGLRPTREGFAVRSKNGKLLFTDGPFTEAKEIVGGYAMVETETPEQARQIAHDFMEIHRIHWPEFECECEVRPLDG